MPGSRTILVSSLKPSPLVIQLYSEDIGVGVKLCKEEVTGDNETVSHECVTLYKGEVTHVARMLSEVASGKPRVAHEADIQSGVKRILVCETDFKTVKIVAASLAENVSWLIGVDVLTLPWKMAALLASSLKRLQEGEGSG